MRRIVTAVAIAATVLGLAAVPAVAAPGVVRIESATQVKFFPDPQPLVCHHGFVGESTISNYTRGTILVFPDENCEARINIPVDPDESIRGRYPSFYALD